MWRISLQYKVLYVPLDIYLYGISALKPEQMVNTFLPCSYFTIDFQCQGDVLRQKPFIWPEKVHVHRISGFALQKKVEKLLFI